MVFFWYLLSKNLHCMSEAVYTPAVILPAALQGRLPAYTFRISLKITTFAAKNLSIYANIQYFAFACRFCGIDTWG